MDFLLTKKLFLLGVTPEVLPANTD